MLVAAVAPATAAAAPRVAKGKGATAAAVVAPDSQLRSSTRHSLGARFVRYRQVVGGLRVLGSDAVLTDAPGRAADLLVDSTRRINQAPAGATIRKAAAVPVARRAGGAQALRARPAATKAIYPTAGGARTVWRVLLASRTPLATYEVLVDARSGRVLRKRDLLRQAFTRTGTATVFDTNAVVGHDHISDGVFGDLTDGNDADSTALTTARSGVTLQRLDTANDCLAGQWAHATLPGPGNGDEVCDAGDDYTALRAADEFEAANAYFHVDRAQQFIRGLGFTNVNARQVDLHVNDFPDDNSFYESTDSPVSTAGDISFGRGGVDDAEDGEVITHEYGHAVQDNQVPGFGVTDQGGAMGEGFSDYLAAALAKTFQPDSLYDACFAEWDELGFEEGGPPITQLPCLRRVDGNPTVAQNGPGTACDGEVHCWGEVWSGALWDIRTQIGAVAADRLVIQSHFSLTADADFHAGAQALLTAAGTEGLSSGSIDFIRNLLVQRGLLDLDRLDSTPAGATPLSLPGVANGTIGVGGDSHDVYAVPIVAGRGIIATLTGSVPEADLRLFGPGTTSVLNEIGLVASSTGSGPNERIAYRATQTGTHYLDVEGIVGSGPYTLVVQPDADSDQLADASDNCPSIANADQTDSDGDRAGDACDPFPTDRANDADGDRIPADEDNCPTVSNRTQRDWDDDGRGDVCDRSSKVSVKRLRTSGRKVVLRVTVRPTLLTKKAFRMSFTQRRAVRVRTTVRSRGSGRFDVTARLPRRGAFRVRATLRDKRYTRARSRAIAVRVR